MASYIDEVFDFNPQDESVFSQAAETTNVNSNIYKTQPKLSKSEDGHYRSKVRFIMNPLDYKRSIVHSVRYSCSDENGFFMVTSPLSNGDKNCPIFKAWKSLRYSGDPVKEAFCKDSENFDKSESDWCIVQIIEDDNFPELVGKFKLMKLPKAISTKITAKMNPSAESKKPAVRLNDYLFGNILEMDVQPGPKDPSNPKRETREVSYDLCEFTADIQPIFKTDGSDLFDADQLDIITDYADAYNLFQKEKASGKMTKKGEAAQAKMVELKEQMLGLYKIAIDYAKENCPDLVKECSYTGWDEALTARVNNWIAVKLAQANGTAPAPTAQVEAVKTTTKQATTPAPAEIDDDSLPF